MIEHFASRAPAESHLAAIERVAALFDAQLRDPDALLAGLAGLGRQLTFDHVGVMVPWGSGAEVVAELQGLGYHITERFPSTVVAGLLRVQCEQPDLAVVVTTAERAGHPRQRIEVFCPENAAVERRGCLTGLAAVIGHVAYRPLGDADFEDLCEAVQEHGFAPLMQGSNGNQRAVGVGAGVCLRYFVNPESAFGQVKLEIVSALPQRAPLGDPRAGAGLGAGLSSGDGRWSPLPGGTDRPTGAAD